MKQYLLAGALVLGHKYEQCKFRAHLLIKRY